MVAALLSLAAAGCASIIPVTVDPETGAPVAVRGTWFCLGFMSDDGRYVAFVSEGANWVANDTNNRPDVFVRDMTTGSIRLVSVDPAGAQFDRIIQVCSLSGDGRYVAFSVSSVMYLHDLHSGKTSVLTSNGRAIEGDVLG